MDVDAEDIVEHGLLEEVVHGALKQARQRVGGVIPDAAQVPLPRPRKVAFEG
jgi:hypothetical protein